MKFTIGIRIAGLMLAGVLTAVSAVAAGTEYTVKAAALNVRDQTAATGRVVAKLRRGERVEVVRAVGEWAELAPEGALKGKGKCFVALRFLERVRTVSPSGSAVESPKPGTEPRKPDPAPGVELPKFLRETGARALRADVTVRGRFFALPADQVKKGLPPYAVLRVSGGEYEVDCYVVTDPGFDGAAYLDKDVRVTGGYYQVKNWKKRVVRLKSIRIQEGE